MPRTFWALTPSYKPAGGIVKIFDYAGHALDAGWDVVIGCPRGMDLDTPLWNLEIGARVRDHPRVRFIDDMRIAPEGDDLVLFSWPPHWKDIAERLPAAFPVSRVIHFIQGTRHANPSFAEGYGLRILSRPMSRVLTNDVVREAIEPFLAPAGLTSVVPLGHRTNFFHKDRDSGLPSDIRVGYMTWKSEVGDRVAALLDDDPRVSFEVIRDRADWDELRELYHAVDVFLCCPRPQEGFYMPGLEAMAAGALVVTPDVEGNMAYCEFGRNALEVAFDDEHSYVEAIREAMALSPDRVDDLRQGGHEAVARHTIESEREGFLAFVEQIDRQSASSKAIARPSPAAEETPASSFALLTGVPRSGTTLATHLLNQLPDVVALSEPLRPADLMTDRYPHRVADSIMDFLRESQRQAVEEGRVTSKLVEGSDTDNYFEASSAELRKDKGELGSFTIDKPLSDAPTIVLKDLITCTAILGDLSKRLPVLAIVRNPLAVLASWETTDINMRDGRSPHAEWFDASLNRRVTRLGDRRERQFALLDWFFERYDDVLEDEQVLKYEDLIASQGRALAVLVPAAVTLDADLASRNSNPAYAGVDIESMANLLIKAGGSWERFYSVGDVEELGGRMSTEAD